MVNDMWFQNGCLDQDILSAPTKPVDTNKHQLFTRPDLLIKISL